MSRAALIVVLGGDKNKRQQNLIRKYLKRRGFSDRQIRDVACPVGETPGISFVLDQYASEVHDLRLAFYSRGLIVAIDADEEEVDKRKSQLAQRLKDANEPPRGDAEAIALVVPKRNIETWIWYLEGNAVDEATDYKRNPIRDNHNLTPAKQAFAEFIISGKEPSANCPSSLKEARVELGRIPHE